MSPEQTYRAQLLEHARAYVAAGLSVIPLSSVVYQPNAAGEQKKYFRPLIRWVKDKPLDTPAEVEWWFGGRQAEVWGIALATGPSGLTMYDLDSYKPDFRYPGFWWSDGANRVPGAWTEFGGKGGGHAYFRNANGARNTAGKSGVDTRGEGGLAICAPTLCYFPDGTVTQWRATRPIGALVAHRLPVGPDAVTGVERPPTRAHTATAPGETYAIDTDRAEQLVREAHEGWLEVPRGGGLHNATATFLGVLLRYLFATGVTEGDVRNEAVAWLEKHDDWAGSVEGWESLPGLLEWSITNARAEPWRLRASWLELIRQQNAVRAQATPQQLTEVLASCSRKGHPTHRAQLKGRLARLEQLAAAFRREGWGTEARAAWASALAGEMTGEFALDALRIAWHRLALGTEDDGHHAVLTELGTVLAHYTKDEGPA